LKINAKCEAMDQNQSKLREATRIKKRGQFAGLDVCLSSWYT